jgi:hypothetical protein
MILGKLRIKEPIEKAMRETRNWLERLGISGLNLDTKYDAKLNIALVRFTYQGKPYEFQSKSQDNCRLNMWAIARVMEYKVRSHLMGIENFQKAMVAYIQLEASSEAQKQGQAENLKDNSSMQEDKNLCLALGISHLASNKELQAHYKKLAKAWHPDMAGSEEAKKSFETKFVEINNTWEKLKKIRGIE